MPRARAFILVLFTLLGASSASAQIRTFGDWIAACDNQRNCVAYSWNRDTYNAYLRIQRDGNPSADAILTLALLSQKPVTFRIESDDPATSLFQNGTISGLPVDKDGHTRLSVEKPAQTIAAFVRKAKKLTVLQIDPPLDDPDQKLDGIPFTGAPAALAWIDDQQKRAGSETAFVKRGAKPVAALPSQPDLPVVTAAKPDATLVPTQHPPEVISRANATCGKEQIDADHVKTVRLGGGLSMYWFFCGQYSGAANLNHAFLLVPDGKPKAAVKPRFVLAPAVVPHIKLGSHKLVTSKTAVFNPEFDAETQTLVAFFAGRSASDCGEMVSWVWNGREFHVGEFRLMTKCEGIPASDWPVLYRARVQQN
jgi:hypothetical protein